MTEGGGQRVEIESWDEGRDGPLSERALRLRLERLGYNVARYVYPPGTFFPDHTHDIDKIDAVLSGSFQITIEKRRMILQAGDCIVVPRGTTHRAEVVGDEPVVSLDATRGTSHQVTTPPAVAGKPLDGG
jgi:quercetin dioxygenase-like cupin family protein